MLETAIIGTGPYGLSIAAHFRRRGIPYRIFGRPMDSWLCPYAERYVAEVGWICLKHL